MTETKMKLEDWLDDLCVRFIINLPEEDLSSVARICFQVEEAQWFYEDFIRPLDPTLPSMSLRSFCLRIFQHCPLLSAFSVDNHMQAFEEFLTYKTRVPVRGAIMLNHAMDSVVLVKGWKKGANWSFPRGKINKDEDDLDCAIREVYEETGFDIRSAGLVPPSDQVKSIEMTMREQHMKLFVFRDVPMDTHFEPKTRKEISKIQWYKLSDLPAFKKRGQQIENGIDAANNANKFYMVAPFLIPLKKWIQQQQKKSGAERAAAGNYMLPPQAHAEETQTEDEGFRSMAERPDVHQLPAQDIQTLEGATAALQKMLKIQPATQGIQSSSSGEAQQAEAKNTGNALLAILRGKPQASSTQQAPPVQPHTPFEPQEAALQMPRNPHHQYSTRPPVPAGFPPQPQAQNFPAQQPPPTRWSNEPVLPPHLRGLQHPQQQHIQQAHQTQAPAFMQAFANLQQAMNSGNNDIAMANRVFSQLPPGFGQGPPPDQMQARPPMQNNAQMRHNPMLQPQFPVPRQAQQPGMAPQPHMLQHPQPLPPQVQSSVFNGGQVHGPVLVPQVMERLAQQSAENSQQPSAAPRLNEQPQGMQTVHGPIISVAAKPEPPKLNSHSLALLNAFKSQEKVPSQPAGPSQIPPAAPEPSRPTNNVQELSSDEISHPKLPTDPHRSSLLNLFKSPPTAPVALAHPAVPPVSAMPAAVPQPRPQPVSDVSPRIISRGPLPDGILTSSKPSRDGRAELDSDTSDIQPARQEAFKPMAILTRPAQPNLKLVPSAQPSPRPVQPTQSSARPTTPRSRPSSAFGKNAPLSADSFKRNDSPKNRGRGPKKQLFVPNPVEAPVPAQAPKPFAPQILKRPQQLPPQATIPLPVELSATSPTVVSPPFVPVVSPPAPVVSPPSVVSPPELPAAVMSPLANLIPAPATVTAARKPSGGAGDHKQTLLSLFGKAPQASLSPEIAAPKTTENATALPVPGVRRPSQTPISDDQTKFLLGYLDAFGKSGI